MQLEDWLDDLCVRFIINLPPEELESVERICFQVEEAQWFYEDFIRPLDPSLPSLTLRAFSLRIFQHCPLFSQWDVQHYTTAFAEFLAYKSRVPVRGAIMLNESMDQVVLVKGWKKGANWSFPRGKINKDEDDLDCAIREVYEETGYDIKGAGLVKDEQEMKYIEVNMREQNMRLYVFRGVPMDTQFEPKTRKEISKIEWYRLTDLPTAKKNKHPEALLEGLATNANKFYMVAPFLVPLKKWIAQQRKRDSRLSSQAHLAPPAIFEETVTEDEADVSNADERPRLQPATSYGPSDLPEVSTVPSHEHDPSSQLKQLLNVTDNMAAPPGTIDELPNLVRSDEPQASALLALLREGSTAHPAPPPRTPIDQMSLAPQMPRSPHQTHPRPPAFSSMPPPPRFPIRPEDSISFHAHLPPSQPPYHVQGDRGYLGQTQPTGPSSSQVADSAWRYQQQQQQQQQSSAPYRQTGDPQFARQLTEDRHIPSVPPASALPKLTNHTRALLDVFKTGSAGPMSSGNLRTPTQTLQNVSSDAFEAGHGPAKMPCLEAVGPSSSMLGLSNRLRTETVDRNQSTAASRSPQSEHQVNLLNLFRKTHEATTDIGTPSATASTTAAPVELSAQLSPGLNEKAAPSDDLLKHLLQQKADDLPRPREPKKMGRSGQADSQTSATVSGPLNQPVFETITSAPRKPAVPNEFARSPIPTARTLFDPNQPPAVKILTRPEDSKHSPAPSPRAPKAAPNTAPKPMHRSTESNKSFQPQILRRPQTESRDKSPQLISDELPAKPSLPNKQLPLSPSHVLPTESPMPPRPRPQPSEFGMPPKPLMQDLQTPPVLAQAQWTEPQSLESVASFRPGLPEDSHRQSLLSLFNPSSVPSGPSPASQPPSKTESPMSTTHFINPINEKPANGVGMISTRSRMGSMASAVSGTSQPPPPPPPPPPPHLPEKRQTTAGDRAFLLGYLGRIANQEN